MLEGALGASGRQLSSKGLEAGMERLGLKEWDFELWGGLLESRVIFDVP